VKKLILPFLLTGFAFGATGDVEIITPKDIKATQQGLAAKAASAGFASKELARYGNHYTMVAYREKTGSAEVHEKEADFFVVQSGTATLLSGGKVVNPHTEKPGEIRGTSLEGGKKQTVSTGDIVHIPAGTPHLLQINGPFTYFVVKDIGQ
jgi:mannose-6-phosphate isomerase-like protein (cupin superfamily)